MEQSISEYLKLDAADILRTPFKIRDIEIKPLTFRQVLNINPYISKIAIDDYLSQLKEAQENSKGNEVDLSKAIQLLDRYGELVYKVLEEIIGNEQAKKCTSEEVCLVFAAIISRLGDQSFLMSINLAQQLSLQTRTGLIAAQKRLSSTSQNY